MKRLGHAIQAATKTMMQIDHVPIKFEVQDIMMFEEGEDSAQGWSQNEMIDCWVSGKGREKNLNDVITQMNEKDEMFAEIEQNHNATRTYQEIHNVLREVAQDHFWKANTKKMQNEELKGYKKQKMQAINERNQQRRQLTMIWPKMEAMKMACRNSVQRQDIDELQKRMILRATMRFWKEQQKLEKTTKAVMMINRQSKAARDNYFVYLLNKAHDKAQIKEVWRLARQCTGTGKGSRRRWRNTPITSRPSTMENIKLMKRLSEQGGMEAKMLMEFDNKYDDIEKHFNQIMDEFAEERYENLNPMSELELHQQAIDDFKNIQRMSRGMKNGKATTPWGIPAEVWKIVLNP